MFEGKDREVLQTLTDNGTITENMKTPCAALNAISMTIKAEEHFWAHRDELLSNVRQQPNEGLHALSQCMCNLVTKCRFPHAQTKDMLKIMFLQHKVHFHEVTDWIHQQDQSKLMYQFLLSHCKLLKSRCKQYQKAREREQAGFTYIPAATASASSIYTNALTTHTHCNKCNYMDPPNKCATYGQQCYTCGGSNHFIALWKQKQRRPRHPHNTPQWSQHNPWRSASQHRGWCSSKSPSRQSHHCHSQSSSTSHSLLHSPSCSTLPHHSHTLHCQQTPHRYSQDSIDIILTDSVVTMDQQPKGSLFTDRAPDSQIAFFTQLQLPTCIRTKLMMVKTDPGSQVNTIPISRNCTLFPNKLNKSRFPKANVLLPTAHTWMSHDGSPKPFLHQFVATWQPLPKQIT